MNTIAHNIRDQDILQWIAQLKEFQLDSIFGQSVLAKSYLLLDQIQKSTLSGQRIDGIVLGSKPYDFQLLLKDQTITSSCSCPFDNGPCKHIAAVILHEMDLDFS